MGVSAALQCFGPPRQRSSLCLLRLLGLAVALLALAPTPSVAGKPLYGLAFSPAPEGVAYATIWAETPTTMTLTFAEWSCPLALSRPCSPRTTAMANR
jgi:hypothetical protein